MAYRAKTNLACGTSYFVAGQVYEILPDGVDPSNFEEVSAPAPSSEPKDEEEMPRKPKSKSELRRGAAMKGE